MARGSGEGVGRSGGMKGSVEEWWGEGSGGLSGSGVRRGRVREVIGGLVRRAEGDWCEEGWGEGNNDGGGGVRGVV